MDQKKESSDLEKNLSKLSSTQTRRTVLKKIALGGGIAAGTATLPTKWTQPIMDRVLVPAHAQTSDPAIYYDSRVSGKGMATPTLLDLVVNASLIGTVLTIGFVYAGPIGLKQPNVVPLDPPSPIYTAEFMAEIQGVGPLKSAMTPSGTLPMGPIQLLENTCPISGPFGNAILEDFGPGGISLDIFNSGPYGLGVVPALIDLPDLGRCNI